MRIKFDKEYLKYYTYAALGVITMTLFYRILDHLGFVLSGITYTAGAVLGYLQSFLFKAERIFFLFRPMRRIEQQALNSLKKPDKIPKTLKAVDLG